MVDRIETVSDEEALEIARRMAREEGILCGMSARRGHGGGSTPGARRAISRQNVRGNSSRFGRALPEYSAVR